MKRTFILAIVAAFILLSAVFATLRVYAPAYNYTVLMSGNVIMAALSLFTYMLVVRQIGKKPDAFVRGVYASSFTKLMVCMIAVVVYAMVNKPNIHKPTLFSLMGIYAVYSTIETLLLSKMARQDRQDG